MGYSTDFNGQFKISPPVTGAHAAKLREISSGRHSKDKGTPGAFCQWELTPDGSALKWDGGENFYHYTAWLKFLIDTYLVSWGHTVNGTVRWSGDDAADVGVLTVVDNKVEEFKARADDMVVVFVPRALLELCAARDPGAEDDLAEAVLANARTTGAMPRSSK